MTTAEQAEVRQIVISVLNELGASVENQDEVPTVADVTTLNDSTTMPFIARTGEGDGTATGYAQIKIKDLAALVATNIDPGTAFPDKMDAITQSQLDEILQDSSNSNE